MPALPVVSSLIHCSDEEVLVDACWALSYLSDDHSGTNKYIEAVVQSGVCDRLVELLTYVYVALAVTPPLPLTTYLVFLMLLKTVLNNLIFTTTKKKAFQCCHSNSCASNDRQYCHGFRRSGKGRIFFF